MAYRISLFALLFIVITCTGGDAGSARMPKKERIKLREEARKMFYHGYTAYMDNAYPADELMPLSCKGRYKGITPSRGDMDDALGNFSLTLVDSLDTLVIMGDFAEFNRAINLVINNVTFDSDIVVSVFETNIRVLGGLLSAHVLATKFKSEVEVLAWYKNELLEKAEDLGKRLLPAFNSTTGIPYGRVNLKHGLKGLTNQKETCTACAGTMILEMAALSRLIGDPIYEEKAHKAMDELWKTRHRTSDLMGTIINIDSGDWIRKDSGVGAGIDSYYEYCLKAYILLGDDKYLARFNRHYNAVMKYISRGPLLLDVHMHRPHLQSRNFMDALLAFWPGLQVLLGDVRPAVATHEMLFQVMQKHTFIPEAFSFDLQVIWGQHPLRPEFLESTYFLHRATNDDHYLYVGKAALKALQKYARVSCGYAAVNDVRTRIHEDRMDSFVLAETFKYLYMLFGYNNDLPMSLDNYVMTTEAHFLPLSLANVGRNTSNIRRNIDEDGDHKFSKTCPNTKFHAEDIRRPMQNILGISYRPKAELQALNDPKQVLALEDMGITVINLDSGQVQLLFSNSAAKTEKLAEDGMQFMKEMSKRSELADTDSAVVPLGVRVNDLTIPGGPGHFGKSIVNNDRYQYQVAYTYPADACEPLTNIEQVKGKIGIAIRGKCTFAQKARHMKDAGVTLAIITDNIQGSTHENSAFFVMSGDGNKDIEMPAVFLFYEDAEILREAYKKKPDLRIVIGVLESIKREFETGCLHGICEDANEFPRNLDEKSFNNLKEVLKRLATEFELTLNNENIREKNEAKEKDEEEKKSYSNSIFGNYEYMLPNTRTRILEDDLHNLEKKDVLEDNDIMTMIRDVPGVKKELTEKSESDILPDDTKDQQHKKVSDNI